MDEKTRYSLPEPLCAVTAKPAIDLGLSHCHVKLKISKYFKEIQKNSNDFKSQRVQNAKNFKDLLFNNTIQLCREENKKG